MKKCYFCGNNLDKNNQTEETTESTNDKKDDDVIDAEFEEGK